MGSGGAGERPGAAFVAVCWGERRRGAHLQGCAAAGGRQGAAGCHPGPAGLPEVGRVVPTDAWQGGFAGGGQGCCRVPLRNDVG